MFQEICKRIVLSGISSGNIESEKKDEYLYGMNIFFNVCINIISMIVIGILTKKLWECLLFCEVYKRIRKYTGGFHFESVLCCYISSCIMYFVVIVVIIYIPFRIYEISALTVISSAILWFLAPVEAVNKPLDKCERLVFKKRARINIAVILATYGGCLFISKEVSYVIAIGIICVMFFAVIGKIKHMT